MDAQSNVIGMNNNRKLLEFAVKDVKDGFKPSHVITVTVLPSGAREVQVNTDKLDEKLTYIAETYDNYMYMKRNEDIQIIGLIIV